MANPKKIFDAALKLKNSRAKKDKETIKNSPFLKETPNMTLGQAKVMKQGTKSLAKTTNRIARQSSKKGSYGSTTIGEANDFLKKMGLDKPIPGVQVKSFPALSTPSLGGLKSGPANMTLGQMDRLTAIQNSEKAKAYAAAFREAKREIKQFKSASQSSTTRAVKKTAKVGIPLISGGSALAYQQKRNK